MKLKAVIIGFALLLAGNIYSLNIVIIESQSVMMAHNMDTKWLSVSIGMGHTASIMPQTTLDNNTFFATTDILIVSSGVITLPANRINTIQQFIQQGGDVYIQSEYDCSVYTTNAAFASIVNTLGGNFTWQGVIAGTLAPMNTLGSISTTNNSIPSLADFWYGCHGTTTCGGNIEPLLQYMGNDFGFIFCPPNTSYGRFITTSDQDWIRDGSNVNNEQALMENIITNLSNPAYSCASVGGPTIMILSQTNISCFGGNNGNATASVTGGSAPYTYSWSPSGGTNSAATGLNAGTYTVTVSDVSGCSNTQTVTVTQPNVITVTTSVVNSSCGNNNGSAVASSIGGTSPYTYSWSTVPVQTTAAVTGLASGTYTITVTDNNGCTQIQMATTASSGPTAIAASNVTITQGQSATLSASGGAMYSWSNGATETIIAVSPTATTVYCVTVTDTNNCTDTDCITVTLKLIDCSDPGELYLPNAFSPNEDGENDELQIYYENINCIQTFKFFVFDRWGEKVFETTEPRFRWNGRYKGKIQGPAVFACYLEATFLTGEQIIKKANISLLR